MVLGESNTGTTLVNISGATPVTNAIEVARDFALANGVVGHDLSRLCVIVEELIANLYEHGGVGPEEIVELSLARESDGVRIIVIDPGRPFDPRMARSGRPRPSRGGGAGIDIVRQWVSRIDYGVTDGCNRLELLVPLRGETTEGAPRV